MKTNKETSIFISIMLFIAIIIFLNSCKKDSGSPKNELAFEGKNYTLTKGNIYYLGISGTEGCYLVDIESDNVNFNPNNLLNSFSGSGSIFYGELISPNKNELTSGTYNYDKKVTASFTFYAYAYYNYNFKDYTGLESTINSGTIKLNKSGSTYTLTINCTDSNNKKVTGYYNGSLSYQDISSLSNSQKEAFLKYSIFRK